MIDLNTKKTGFYYDMIGYGYTEYRREVSGRLSCIVYHNYDKAKVEKRAKKMFPHFAVVGCKELGYSAYYIIPRD